MMRYLVTGGAGYIGSHLTDSLLADGHEVVVIDNFSTGKEENIAHLSDNSSFTLYKDTILNDDRLEEIVPTVDGIYHLAAAVGVKNIIDDPLQGMITNVDGSHNVIASAAKHKVKILIASSSEVYGLSDRCPLREDDIRVLGQTNIPRWSYAVSKALDEHLMLAYRKQCGLKCSAVRYFNSYGPRIDEKGYGSVIARFMSYAFQGRPLEIFGSGEQTRSFTFIEDTVRGTRLAHEVPEADGLVFNIGNSKEETINELADMIEEEFGTELGRDRKTFEEVFGPDFQETPRRQPDTTRAKEILGFEAQTDIKDGLKKTVEWARSHYESAR